MAIATNSGQNIADAPTLLSQVPATPTSAVSEFLDTTPAEVTAAVTFGDVFTAGDENYSTAVDWTTGPVAVLDNAQLADLVNGLNVLESSRQESGGIDSSQITVNNFLEIWKNSTDPLVVKMRAVLELARMKSTGIGEMKVGDAYELLEQAASGSAGSVAAISAAYQAILANGRNNTAGWVEAAIKLYTDNKDNKLLTPGQLQALKELHDSATELNSRNTTITTDNDTATTANTNNDAINAAITGLSRTAASSLDEYIAGATQERALRAGMMTTDFNRGGGVLGSIQGAGGEAAAGAEGGQAAGFELQVAKNQEAAEGAFLALTLDQQNLALQNAGVTLSEDIAANKTSLLNWLADLENSIKEAGLTASAEQTRVLAEIQRQRLAVEAGNMDRKNGIKIFMGILGALTLLAAAGITIGTGGAAAPLALGLAGGGMSLLGNLAG